jgi:4-amino-4-deoxy-L-arabinose transferase-like glycosyltransferase
MEVVAEKGVDVKPATVAVVAAAPEGWPVEAAVFAWLVILGGAIFRVCAWLNWRSFWLDELYLVHNITHRSWGELLLRPLDYWQTAPAGYLIVERICFVLFGDAERGLRLPSLLAGLGAMVLFYYLARRVLPLRAALVGIILFASLDPLVSFSQEAKPYSTDVVAALAVLFVAARAMDEPGSISRWVQYFLVGSAAVLFSYPAILVLLATGIVLLIELRHKFWPSAAGALAACCAVEGINWFVFMRPFWHTPAHKGLFKFWFDAGGFPPLGPNPAAKWIWGSLYGIFQSDRSMDLGNPGLAMFLAFVGLGGLVLSRRRMRGVMLAAPVVLALVTAFVKVYPLGDRLALYLVPMLALLTAAGIDVIWGDGHWRRSGVGMLAGVMVIAGPLLRSVYILGNPSGREESKQVYQWIKQNWSSSDLLVLSRMAVYSYNHYGPQTGMAGLHQVWIDPAEANKEPEMVLENTDELSDALGHVVVEPDRSSNPAKYLDDMDQLVSPPADWHWPAVRRIWVVFIHVWGGDNSEPVMLCLPELERKARLIMHHHDDGAAVYLFEVPAATAQAARSIGQ